MCETFFQDLLPKSIRIPSSPWMKSVFLPFSFPPPRPCTGRPPFTLRVTRVTSEKSAPLFLSFLFSSIVLRALHVLDLSCTGRSIDPFSLFLLLPHGLFLFSPSQILPLARTFFFPVTRNLRANSCPFNGGDSFLLDVIRPFLLTFFKRLDQDCLGFP